MDKKEILKEALRRYPPGTVMISDYSLKMGNSVEKSTYTIISNKSFDFEEMGIQLQGDRGTPYVYWKEKWAEIVSRPTNTYELW